MFEYTFVEKGDRESVKREVKKLVSEGWRPQGGCSLSFATNGGTFYIQTMVKGELPKQEIKREWKVVRRVCSALVPEVGIKEFEKELEELTKDGWKSDGDTLSIPAKTKNDPTFILLKPMYREKE